MLQKYEHLEEQRGLEMERLKRALNSFRVLLLRTVRERKRECLAVGAGTAVVMAGVGTMISAKPIILKMTEGVTVTQEAAAGEDEKTDTGDEDPDPDGKLPCGYAGVIDGIMSTKGLSKSYRAVGGPCETVLVGQWMIKAQTIAKLDVSTRMIKAIVDADQQVEDVSKQMRMSDKDYENLLAIVEAEAGGEDLDGRIMVANVILNRVASDQFPDDVTSVIWDRTGGSPQFSPTEDGRIYTVSISDVTREAVNHAIDGEDLSQGALYFIARDQADEKNVKWFDEKLKFLFEHGGHSFYTGK